MTRLAHAASLRRRFQKIVAGAVLAPIPLAILVACSAGSGVAATELGGGGEAGNGCRALSIPDAGACEQYQVSVTEACELDAGNLYLPGELCREVCGRDVTCMKYGIGENRVSCGSPCPVDGRRYDLLDDRDAPDASDVGSALARMAFYESASVDAFAYLARELAAHGAPPSLLRGCRRARVDEVRHARMARTIAERYGGVVDVAPPPPPSLSWRASRSGLRSLEAIAIENAVEGCVRETFGVLVGMWQAEHAPTKQLRAFFAVLARDESRHAALAARIDAWLLSRLDREACARVELARERALASLRLSLSHDPLPGLGLPSAAHAHALLHAFASTSPAPLRSVAA